LKFIQTTRSRKNAPGSAYFFRGKYNKRLNSVPGRIKCSQKWFTYGAHQTYRCPHNLTKLSAIRKHPSVTRQPGQNSLIGRPSQVRQMKPGTNKNLCNGCPKNIFLMHKNFVSDSYFQTEVQEKGVPPHSYEATGGKTKKAAINRTYQDSMSTKKSRETRPKR